MSDGFDSVTNLYIALRKIEDCLGRADAATDPRIKQEELIQAGTYACRAFSNFRDDKDLWDAVRDHYNDPEVRDNLARMLPDKRFDEFAVPQVVELLVRLDYEPPEDAQSVVSAARHYTEKLNELLFRNGDRVAGLDLALQQSLGIVEDCIDHVAMAACDLVELGQSRQLTEKEVHQFRSVLARACKVGLAVVATAVQIQPVQTLVVATTPSILGLIHDVTETARIAMLALGPATIIEEVGQAIVSFQHFKLTYGPGSTSRLADLDLRSSIEQQRVGSFNMLRARIDSSIQEDLRRNFRQNVRKAGSRTNTVRKTPGPSAVEEIRNQRTNRTTTDPQRRIQRPNPPGGNPRNV